jgi:hypothetical protein
MEMVTHHLQVDNKRCEFDNQFLGGRVEESTGKTIGLSEEEDDQYKSDEDLSDDQGKDHMNGTSDLPATSMVPEAGPKRKDRRQEKTRGSHKKSNG